VSTHHESSHDVRTALLLILSTPLGAILDVLADRLRAFETHDEPETYSSHDLPPRTTRRRFAELCRANRVEGAHQEGRLWVCSRQAWHASRSRPVRPPPPTVVAQSERQLVERADELLRRKGLRVVGGVR
jgi:hypothetical protein